MSGLDRLDRLGLWARANTADISLEAEAGCDPMHKGWASLLVDTPEKKKKQRLLTLSPTGDSRPARLNAGLALKRLKPLGGLSLNMDRAGSCLGDAEPDMPSLERNLETRAVLLLRLPLPSLARLERSRLDITLGLRGLILSGLKLSRRAR